MARIPDEVLERIKQDVSVLRLAEAMGGTFKKNGDDNFIGLCPWHDDSTPSLVISVKKNVYHCLGCGAKGSPIDWVMRQYAVSFPHAAKLLQEGLPESAAAPTRPLKASRVCHLPPPIELDADDREVLLQVVGFYHDALKQSPEVLAYLEKRGLRSEEAIEHFRLGFANRTLGYRLPQKTRKLGDELRGRLEKLGIYRASGHEHFNGSLVVPVFGEDGSVTEMYGRKITPNLTKGTPLHLYLPGPHKGVWNIGAVKASKEIIICEALLDALTFWVHGYRNVTASYGVNGFTDEHLEAFQRHGVERVLIAYDRDDAGDRAAKSLAERLIAEGFECYRVELPHGMDVNEYALKLTPAAKSLDLVLRKASWLGKGKPPATKPVVSRVPAAADLSLILLAAKEDMLLAAKEEPTSAREPEPPGNAPPPLQGDPRPLVAAGTASSAEVLPGTVSSATTPPGTASSAAGCSAVSFLAAASSGSVEHASSDLGEGLAPLSSPLPAAPPVPPPYAVKDGEVCIQLGERLYRVRGVPLTPTCDRLPVMVLLDHGDHPEQGSFADRLDLFIAKSREAYARQAATELGFEQNRIRADLGTLLNRIEEYQHEQLRLQLEIEKSAKQPEMSEEEREQALELLRDPKLLDRILVDFDRCGVVGEETNKLVGYLATVSRKLERPLAVIIQSSSAAGKSSLMEAILAFVPGEEREKYSAVTGQSLFYAEEMSLKHKVLAIVEEEGAERATYALKLLQSEGELTIASTGKDAETGKLTTHTYHVEGPVMILLTTTAIEIDEELLNRCVVLTVNEDREQTRAIHRLQRESLTLEGHRLRSGREQVLKLHRNAQRLLRTLRVVAPSAPKLTFRDDLTRTRRDHMKYLSLIQAIAFLHQCQRPTLHDVEGGFDYIEATVDDIVIANRLASEVLGRSLDELAPQTRRLLLDLDRLVVGICEEQKVVRSEVRFSRREVRDYSGWNQTQLKLHLDRLVDYEYLAVHHGGRGQRFEYELLYDGSGKDGERFLTGLIDPTTLNLSGSEGQLSGSGGELSGPCRAAIGSLSASYRGDETSVTTDGTAENRRASDPVAENALLDESPEKVRRTHTRRAVDAAVAEAR